MGDIRRDHVADGYWKLSRNKTSKRIDVYPADHAAAMLTGCPDFGDKAPFFSASTSDGQHVALRADAFSHAMSRHIRPRLDQVAEELNLAPFAEHWTPHDLRRTVRSGLSGWAGVFPHIAERTINQAVGGMRAVYDHANYRPHLTDALQAWDAELGRILAGKQATEVPIRRASA